MGSRRMMKEVLWISSVVLRVIRGNIQKPRFTRFAHAAGKLTGNNPPCAVYDLVWHNHYGRQGGVSRTQQRIGDRGDAGIIGFLWFLRTESGGLLGMSRKHDVMSLRMLVVTMGEGTHQGPLVRNLGQFW